MLPLSYAALPHLDYKFTSGAHLQVNNFIGSVSGVRHRSVLCVYANQTLVLPDVFCDPERRPESSSGCDPECPGTIRNEIRNSKASGNRRASASASDPLSDFDGSGSGDSEAGSGFYDDENIDVNYSATDPGQAGAVQDLANGEKPKVIVSVNLKVLCRLF